MTLDRALAAGICALLDTRTRRDCWCISTATVTRMGQADMFVREWLLAPVRGADGAFLGTLGLTGGESEPVKFDQSGLDTLQQTPARPGSDDCPAGVVIRG